MSFSVYFHSTNLNTNSIPHLEYHRIVISTNANLFPQLRGCDLRKMLDEKWLWLTLLAFQNQIMNIGMCIHQYYKLEL